MNYDDMPAGPELDRRVAEGPMGWMEGLGPATVTKWWRNGTGFAHPVHDWHPSTDIAHAWEVVEHLSRHGGGGYRLHLRQSTAHWHANLGATGADECEAETAPLAICRAALKAMDAK